MKVAAIIVTRGDVDLEPILSSLPDEWQLIVWTNSGTAKIGGPGSKSMRAQVIGSSDLSVYGRYAAIEYTDADLIYVQDDDCIVSDPQALAKAWYDAAYRERIAQIDAPGNPDPQNFVVCNQPPEFRHDFYTDHALVGFGAVFHRDAPARAFNRMGETDVRDFTPDFPVFLRTCDIAFTALTPRVLVDVPKTNLWWAEDSSRMYRQPQHVEERLWMLELVKKVRDA